jgi:uncharacterized protein (TIGR03435 family)
MPEFALMTSPAFDRPLVDETGLKGRYDLRLDIAPYLPQPSAGSRTSAIDAAGMIITALREELGLKVEARKESAEFVVVDRAGRTPTAN